MNGKEITKVLFIVLENGHVSKEVEGGGDTVFKKLR